MVEIINPNEPEKKPEEKKEALFSAKFTDEGFLEIKCDLKAAIASEDHRLMLKGFLAEKADQAMMVILQERGRIQQEKQKIIQVGNKNGMKGFVSKLFR